MSQPPSQPLSPQPIRTAIVGCGVIGRHHGAVLAAHPRFEVTALVDVDPASAAELAELLATEHGARRPTASASFDTILTRDDVDLVVVCTPSGTHIDLATEAITAGLHTVVEKPLDVDLAKAVLFADLAADAAARGIHVSVISQHRFDAASIAVHRAAADGRLGRLTSAVASVAWWRSQGYYDGGDWRGTWALDGGGAVMNQGVHTVDLLRWFLGRPVEVDAQTALLAHDRLEVEDVAVAIVRFESGALAVVHATTAAFPGLSVRVQVHGSAGSAIIDNDRLEYFHAADGSDGGDSAYGASGVTGVGVSGNRAEAEVGFADTTAAPAPAHAFLAGHTRQYDSIAHSIDTGAAPGVSVQDALESVALVRAIYLSATLGQRIAFDDVLAGHYDSVPARTGQAQAGSPS